MNLQIPILVFGGGLLFYTANKGTIGFLVSWILRMLLFLWGIVAFSYEQRWVLFFYLVAGIIFLVFKLYLGKKAQVESSKTSFLKSMIVGGFIYLVALALSSQTKAQFLGAPQLAISSTNSFVDWITLQFSPLISGTLGTFENALFIMVLAILIDSREIWTQAIYVILNAIAPLFVIPWVGMALSIVIQVISSLIVIFAIVLPFTAVMFLFGIFHVVAYALQWTAMIWAMLMMGFMIASYYATGRDITAADLFHFCWNGVLTTKESLSIAF